MDDGFLEYVLDQLGGLDGVRYRRMFGGVGLYAGEVFFGLIGRGRLYFLTDDSTRERYRAAGMAPFHPKPGVLLKNYYEVPVDVLEDDSTLCAWARDAITCQVRRAGATKKTRKV